VSEQPLQFSIIYGFSVCLIGAHPVCERKTIDFLKTFQQDSLTNSTFGEENSNEERYILNWGPERKQCYISAADLPQLYTISWPWS
jgi:hypothetical protein